MKTDIKKRKLFSGKGETLVEVLVALLIAALAMGLLFTMLMTSGKLIQTSREDLNAYYISANQLAEMTDSTSGSVSLGSGSVEIKADGFSVCLAKNQSNLPIDYYVNEFNGTKLISYKIHE